MPADMRAPVPSLPEMIDALLALVRDYTGRSGEGWNSATTLEQAGVDSLAFAELLIEIEDHFDIGPTGNLRPADVLIATIEDLARFVRSALQHQSDRLTRQQGKADQPSEAAA